MSGEAQDTSVKSITIEEATVEEIQLAFKENNLTSRQLVQHYINAIEELNPTLSAVIEVNPDALSQADQADRERNLPGGCLSGMHGIPVMLKDNIATKDKLNTAAGSLALLNSVVPRDAGVVDKLRKAGAVILGKAGLTEWCNFRSSSGKMPDGWSARGGTNPYVRSTEPGGSSTGSAVSVAANLVTVSLGTETSGSIVQPCSISGVVGIKPTVGLTSRAGTFSGSLRQDTVGPIGRTVSDAVYLLDEIVGYDPRDEITKENIQYIPSGGFKQCLKHDGLNNKRLGNLWHYFKVEYTDPEIVRTFEDHFNVMSQNGAVLINDLAISNIETVMNPEESGEQLALKYEFKRDLNVYLSNLLESLIRSLTAAIAFNEDPNYRDQEKLDEYGQEFFLMSEQTSLPNSEYTNTVEKLTKLCEEGFEKFMNDHNLDAMLAPEFFAYPMLAIGGYPAIVVPAGYDPDGVPYAIMFAGLKGSEAKLIEIAYAFEQLTKVRKPPRVATSSTIESKMDVSL
ncbi:putative amidase At4g34880 isoform X2 [Tasmannia lanceolata]|uniref:putative amidase At4g34880 isoform X2 n=1 Tax=Tasmannia lanceolata TaxID=3420 RepID=UPI004063439B